MLLLEAIGIVLAGVAAIVFAYSLRRPEGVRKGELVRPGDDLQGAMMRVGNPIWLTDRRLFSMGTVLIVLSMIFLIVGLAV
jgi:hypothetical protein